MKKAWKAFKKWFIPHQENNHKPHILRSRTVAIVCALAIAVEFFFLSDLSMPAFRSPILGDIVVTALTDGTNSARIANSMPSLQVSPLLTEAAQEKANDMAANGYFAHTSPAGLTPWHWFENVGYGFTYAGENLAVDFSDSQDVITAWLNSPEHRANIMNENFTQFGIAIATGTYEGQPAVFVAEEFGTPSSLMAAAESAGTGSSSGTRSAPKVEPTTIATSESRTSSSGQMFVAVKGASTKAVSAVPAVTRSAPKAKAVSVSSNVPATSVASVTSSGPGTVPSGAISIISIVTSSASAATESIMKTNVVQQAIANPRSAVNSIYLLMALVFAFALLLNIFVKIRIQHPDIIMGGVIAISLAGMFIVLNQHIFLSALIK
jgi:hypothetical protein